MKQVIIFLLLLSSFGTTWNNLYSSPLITAPAFNIVTKSEHTAFPGEEESGLKIPKTIVAPFASLVAFAKKRNIPISGIELADENSQAQKGDCITLLVTLYQGHISQQWIAIIKQDNLNEAELRLPSLAEEVIYTSSGRKLNFKNTRTALDVHFIGPFKKTGIVSTGNLFFN
jgi:hypothetical protein